MECLNFTHHLKHPPCRQTLASHSVDLFVFNSLGKTRGCQLGRKHWMFSPDAPNNFNSMLILRRARLGAVQVWWGCSGLTKFIMVIGLMSLCSHHKLTRTQTLFVYRPVNVDAHSLGNQVYLNWIKPHLSHYSKPQSHTQQKRIHFSKILLK